MYVILTYDINAKRVAKAMKICRKYLKHVQKSVFEGTVTEATLRCLRSELEKCIDSKQDQISIYEFESLKYTHKEIIGVFCDNGNVI